MNGRRPFALVIYLAIIIAIVHGAYTTLLRVDSTPATQPVSIDTQDEPTSRLSTADAEEVITKAMTAAMAGDVTVAKKVFVTNGGAETVDEVIPRLARNVKAWRGSHDVTNDAVHMRLTTIRVGRSNVIVDADLVCGPVVNQVLGITVHAMDGRWCVVLEEFTMAVATVPMFGGEEP